MRLKLALTITRLESPLFIQRQSSSSSTSRLATASGHGFEFSPSTPDAMPKRPASELPEPPPKRLRPNFIPHIKRLSDELFLRIASFLPIIDLTSCQMVSKRFSRIAIDGQIWKALFYRRFVRPRASRIPGVSRAPASSLHYSSRNSRWLEDEGLVRTSATDWKELYKLRHNWNRGICGVSEIDITANALPPPIPPLLVRFHEGVVFTADLTRGLRAWKLRRNSEETLIASGDLYQGSADLDAYGAPTAMAVDEDSNTKKAVSIVVGFERGGFGVYQLDTSRSSSTFILRYIHPRNNPSPGNSSHGPMITSIAYCTPCLLTMTASQLFTVYRFTGSADIDESKDIPDAHSRMMHAPKILSSLRSHTVWPPLSLSLRRSAQNSVIACIVYAFPLYVAGWSVGIQELRFSDDADRVMDSRIATAVPSGFNPLSATAGSSPASSPTSRSGTGSRSQSLTNNTPLAQPTCLSYAHPYLLASHADNTLTLYLVKSTATAVSIDSGQRLWGHTSGVSTAQVSGRGKAVSVSARGSELRVWELEGGVSEKRRLSASVRVQPQNYPNDDVGKEWCENGFGWLGGFDEEKVVVLREKDEGRQALVVYDFTR